MIDYDVFASALQAFYGDITFQVYPTDPPAQRSGSSDALTLWRGASVRAALVDFVRDRSGPAGLRCQESFHLTNRIINITVTGSACHVAYSRQHATWWIESSISLMAAKRACRSNSPSHGCAPMPCG